MKAYDPKRLLELIRKHGGPEAEKLAKANWKAVKEWALESAVLSENKIDNVGIPLAASTLGPVVESALDNISPEV